MNLPAEIYDCIAFHVENEGNSGAKPWKHDYRHYTILDSEAQQRLRDLRLVSKAFCRSASARLFRHIITNLFCDRNTANLLALREISESPCNIYVRQIGFEFDGYSVHEHVPKTSNVEDVAGILSSCLARFPALKCLEFLDAPNLQPELKSAYFDTVAAALRYVPLPSLTELEFTLPITHDFGRFFPSEKNSLRIPIEKVLRRLQHLGLYVSEFTNREEAQQLLFMRVLPENATYPNQAHASHLFRMVELAANLKSLAIRSTDTLDLDDIKFPFSLCLRSLDLSRVSISAHTLLSLADQCSKTIRYIDLLMVQLNAGTWEHVLSQMCNLPHLVYFTIDCSGYSTTGSSAHLKGPENATNIETSMLDLVAMRDLLRKVNANRIVAGLEPFPETTDNERMAERVLRYLDLEGNSSSDGSDGDEYGATDWDLD
ncbi:hypothetical protein PHISP_06127 [Aspergillus sp. HF37]|nr:hypothetical protein PHISP_06127 [Aspergillus sp. HF37]